MQYRTSHPPTSLQSIQNYAQQTGGNPPADYVEFCLADNGGRLSYEYSEYTVPDKYPSDKFAHMSCVGVGSLCGIGFNHPLSIDSVEQNEETIEFCELRSSEYWVVAIGLGNYGYIMNVSSSNNGQIDYCFFDTGEHYPVADSFTEFLKGLHKPSEERFSD